MSAVKVAFGAFLAGTMITLGGTSALASGNSSAFNRVVSKLSAEWWQWAYSIPADVHPLNTNGLIDGQVDPDALAETRRSCGIGQRGNVWFLGGAFGSTNDGVPDTPPFDIRRECVVPEGTKLFVPLINAACTEAQDGFTSEVDLANCVRELADLIVNLNATIDGRRIRIREGRNRAQTGLFPINFPPGAIFGVTTDEFRPSVAVADGFYVLTKPLREGTHTIEVSGSVPEFNFTLDVVYEVIVVPVEDYVMIANN